MEYTVWFLDQENKISCYKTTHPIKEENMAILVLDDNEKPRMIIPDGRWLLIEIDSDE